MKSSSLLKAAKELGFTLDDVRIYRDELIHNWYLNPTYQEKLIVYILRETTTEKFFFNLKDGELRVKGKAYSVIWLNTPDTVKKASILLLSLRYCKYLDRGYAIVKVLLGDSEYSELEY